MIQHLGHYTRPLISSYIYFHWTFVLCAHSLLSHAHVSCRPVVRVLPCALVFTVSEALKCVDENSHCTVITSTSLANSDMDSQHESLCCQSFHSTSVCVCGREKEIQRRTMGLFVLGQKLFNVFPFLIFLLICSLWCARDCMHTILWVAHVLVTVLSFVKCAYRAL